MAIEYELAVPEPHTHLLEVHLRIPAATEPVEVSLPSWAPGSYLIREFARNVQDFEAHDGSGLRLSWRKTSKNVWRIEGDLTGGVAISYRVYANELTVRTSHVDSSHAFVNGTSVFMYARGMEREPLRLRIVTPAGWRVATSLRETERGDYVAENYDELVDCPLEIGPHRTIAWVQDGVPHRFAVWGDGEVDDRRLIADTRRIIDVCSRMFGGLPYERYLFILHPVKDGRGGLEHRSSSALQVPFAALTDPHYESLLALIAHEFFHVWLGKRIRPAPLGPFDYSSENYTRSLWVVEGFTTYYTDRILVRAGLMTPTRYLERLGDSIARLRSLPGRKRQSLEESSFDAWIRFYRPDANTPNSQVSYYQKGALVALALDLEIRRRSGGERSLDDVMRLLWERYGMQDVGFPEEGKGDIRDVVEEIYGGAMGDLFSAYVSGVEEIDFDRHLEAVGLELAAADGGSSSMIAGADIPGGGSKTAPDDAEEAEQGSPPERSVPAISPPGVHEARLGLRLREESGRLLVTHVLAGTSGYDAGLNAGDEIVTVAGVRATIAEIARLVDRAEAGDSLAVTVIRRDRLQTLSVSVSEATERLARITAAADADASARRCRTLWLGAP